jgi:outer membrane cobalamin receptor
VPGVIVTQHSGDGKANQYFLRGFNLDHGTDFATFVDGMPVNMRSHAHGQGYTDLNFLIPELVDRINYKKGPYYADEGDFASAGAAHMTLANKLKENTASVTVGENQFVRSVVTGSRRWARAIWCTAPSWRTTTARGWSRSVPQEPRRAALLAG